MKCPKCRRRTAPADPGNVQQLFPFFAESMPAPATTPDIDDARFEPDQCDVVAIDNFQLHFEHAERLETIRSFHRRPRLSGYIASWANILCPDDDPKDAGEK